MLTIDSPEESTGVQRYVPFNTLSSLFQLINMSEKQAILNTQPCCKLVPGRSTTITMMLTACSLSVPHPNINSSHINITQDFAGFFALTPSFDCRVNEFSSHSRTL